MNSKLGINKANGSQSINICRANVCAANKWWNVVRTMRRWVLSGTLLELKECIGGWLSGCVCFVRYCVISAQPSPNIDDCARLVILHSAIHSRQSVGNFTCRAIELRNIECSRFGPRNSDSEFSQKWKPQIVLAILISWGLSLAMVVATMERFMIRIRTLTKFSLNGMCEPLNESWIYGFLKKKLWK